MSEPVSERAVLLFGRDESDHRRRASIVLDFFGLASCVSSVAEAMSTTDTDIHIGKHRLICSPRALTDWVSEFTKNSHALACWRESVHSAFVQGTDDLAALQQLVQMLSGEPNVSFRERRPADREVLKVEGEYEFCGVMSGVSCDVSVNKSIRSLVADPSTNRLAPIITVRDGIAFFRIDVHGVPVFVSVSHQCLDLTAPITARRFDVREHFSESVPIVMYLKWAFSESGWTSPETNACVIIDDPLLTPRYGFLDYQELDGLMEQHQFTTNIAFIPWNWRRSDPRVVALFGRSYCRYSLSIHGCDHTAAEFGTTDLAVLEMKLDRATDRMERHRQLTGLQHDTVMVFPQGVFSKAAIRALKPRSFSAVVNTEVVSVDGDGGSVRVRDVWDVAALHHEGFPIFTRRYPTDGLANFAFDILLGKPCLVVIHHEFLHGGAAHLADFVDQLNSLKRHLSWRSLGELVRRSYRERKVGPQCFEVQMYGTELYIQGRPFGTTTYRVKKTEPDVSAVAGVTLDSRALAWRGDGDGLECDEFELPAAETSTLCVNYKRGRSSSQLKRDGLGARTATRLRRYACEIRDNVVTPGMYASRSCLEALGGLIGRQ